MSRSTPVIANTGLMFRGNPMTPSRSSPPWLGTCTMKCELILLAIMMVEMIASITNMPNISFSVAEKRLMYPMIFGPFLKPNSFDGLFSTILSRIIEI